MSALIAAFAVLAGLVIAAIAAIAGVVLFFFRRSRGLPAPRRAIPVFPAAGLHRSQPQDVDVIDVLATEVPPDSASR